MSQVTNMHIGGPDNQLYIMKADVNSMAGTMWGG